MTEKQVIAPFGDGTYTLEPGDPLVIGLTGPISVSSGNPVWNIGFEGGLPSDDLTIQVQSGDPGVAWVTETELVGGVAEGSWANGIDTHQYYRIVLTWAGAGEVEATFDGNTLTYLMSSSGFATPEQLASWMQEPELDLATAQLVLASASARIVSQTLQQFELVESTVTLWDIPGGVVALPQRPVTDVSSVEAVYVTGPPWTLTAGIDYIVAGQEIRLLNYRRGGYPVANRTAPMCPQGLLVTYTHGYATVPGDVVECCLVLAAEAWDNPGAAGSESIDDYRWQAAAGMTRGQELLAALRERYRPARTSVGFR